MYSVEFGFVQKLTNEIKFRRNIIYLERGYVLTVPENIEDRSYEVDFLNCVIDKADDFKVVDSDSHFAEFVGIHLSKIREGKLFLQDIIKPSDRQRVIMQITKKDSPYIYTSFDVINEEGDLVFVHCTAQNYEDSSKCRLVLADVSKSREKTEKLEAKTQEMNHLIDLVTGGVCQFQVTEDMHFNATYMNDSCSQLFGADQEKDNYDDSVFRIDDLIYPEDRTVVFQAVGKAMATGEDLDLECRMMTCDKEYVWFKLNASVRKYDGVKTPIVNAMFSDISRVKEAEQRADNVSEKLANLLNNLTGAMFFSSYEKPFEAVIFSGDFAKLLGYTRNEIYEKLNCDISNLVKDNVEDLEEDMKTQLSKKGKSKVNYNIKTKTLGIVEVIDRRKLVTQRDGSTALICEIEVDESQLDY